MLAVAVFLVGDGFIVCSLWVVQPMAVAVVVAEAVPLSATDAPGYLVPLCQSPSYPRSLLAACVLENSG